MYVYPYIALHLDNISCQGNGTFYCTMVLRKAPSNESLNLKPHFKPLLKQMFASAHLGSTCATGNALPIFKETIGFIHENSGYADLCQMGIFRDLEFQGFKQFLSFYSAPFKRVQ